MISNILSTNRNWKENLVFFGSFSCFFLFFQGVNFLTYEQKNKNNIKNIETALEVLQLEYEHTPRNLATELKQKHIYLSGLISRINSSCKFYIINDDDFSLEANTHILLDPKISMQDLKPYLAINFKIFYWEKNGFRVVIQKIRNTTSTYSIFVQPIDTMLERHLFDTYENISLIQYILSHKDTYLFVFYFLFMCSGVLLLFKLIKKNILRAYQTKEFNLLNKLSKFDNDIQSYSEKYYTLEKQHLLLQDILIARVINPLKTTYSLHRNMISFSLVEKNDLTDPNFYFLDPVSESYERAERVLQDIFSYFGIKKYHINHST